MLDNIGGAHRIRGLNMEVDIREIKSYVISLHDAVDRKQHMIQVMKLIQFNDWEFFDAVDVRNKFPYWIGCGLSHFLLLSKAKYPCFVFEDDIAPSRWGKHSINLESGGITYLGLSSWGLKNGPCQHMGVEFEAYDKDRVIVRHMTSAHAIYYPSKEIAQNFYEGIIKHMFETQRPFDEYYAKCQLKHKTYALKNPLFYQKCPKNEQYTYFNIG